MKLSDKTIKASKPKERQYKLTDGEGLYLLVRPNGSKLWQMKYRYAQKGKTLSIGAYPVVTLKEARDAKIEAKRLLAQNPPKDPSTEKQKLKKNIIRNAENTFKAIALEWYDYKKPDWSDNYAKKMRLGLEKNVLPFIGNRPIAEITPPEMLSEVLRRIEKRGSLDIAARTKQIFIHVPSNYQAEFKKALGRDLPFKMRKPSFDNETITYPPYGELHIKSPAYGLIKYMSKGLNSETPVADIIPSYQGKIWGKRWGMSKTLRPNKYNPKDDSKLKT